MNTIQINQLKNETIPFLSEKGRRHWPYVEWDKEEVGSSKIGFINLDLNIKPEYIAKFINSKAEKIIGD